MWMPARLAGASMFVQHLDGVVLDDAHIGEAALADLFQQRADAGRVDLDAEVVVFGMGGGNLGQPLAHAEADFQNARRRRELDGRRHGIEIEHGRLVRQHELRPDLGQRARLAGADAPGAQHIGTDARVRAGFTHDYLLPALLLSVMRPLVGELGLAW